MLHAPAPDALAVWNNAEAPEPPANLTATLKGAVIHRFCETYAAGDDPEERLRKSFADVVRSRQAEFADRLVEINVEEAIAELLPLAEKLFIQRRLRASRTGARGLVRAGLAVVVLEKRQAFGVNWVSVCAGRSAF